MVIVTSLLCRRALLRASLAGVLALGGVALAPPGVEKALAAPTGVALFDARSVGSIVNFSFHVPEAFFPFQITGGMLESTGRATSSPQAFGTAGLAPVPLATSIGLVIPQVIPGTDIPVPDDVQQAFKSIDFTALPNGCQANYPPVSEGQEEATCGGPYQRDAALGFTAAGLNGHVRTSGTFEDPFATRTVAVSRAGDITVPGLQAKFHQAYSRSDTGLNGARLPEGRAVAAIDSLSILGNLLRIDGIRSETVAATDGTAQGADVQSSLTIRAASVFGIPVTIGPDGIAVNHQAVPSTELRTLAAQVESALAGAGGMRVRLLPAPPVQVQGGEVTAGSGAIEIAYISQSPTPMNVVQRIGYTQARVNAVPETSTSEVVGETSPSLGIGFPDGDRPVGEDAASGTPDSPVPLSPSLPLSSVPSGRIGSVVAAPAAVLTSELPPLREAVVGESTGAALAAPDAARSPSGYAAESAAAVASPRRDFDVASRTRLKAFYGGVAALSLLGLMFLPLLRTSSRRLAAPVQ